MATWLRKVFAFSNRPARPARPRLEALEDRLTPAISWVNKGDDNFGGFGAKADTARAVVQAAINDWNRVIVNNRLVDGTFNLTVELNSLDDGTHGLGGGVKTINNRPYKGRIQLNSKLVDEYFIDPTPNDHSEFQDVITPFAARATDPAAKDRPDLYSLVIHEIGHVVGMTNDFNSEMRRLIKDGERNGVKLVNTGQKDPYGAGNLFLAQGPSGTVVLTGTNLGEVSDPFHVARAQVVAHGFGTYYATADFMTYTKGSGQRRLISDQVAMLLKDLYGYGVVRPSSMESFFAVYDTAKKELVVRGAGDYHLSDGTSMDVVSHDKIHVTTAGPNIVVTVTVDTNFINDMVPGVPGSGPGKRTFTSVFPKSAVKSLRVLGDDGNDTVTVNGSLAGLESILVQGGAGHDTINLGGNLTGAKSLVVLGDDGNDKVNVTSSLPAMAVLPAVLGGNGNDTINLTAAVGTGFNVFGFAGNDVIHGSNRGDTLQGGDGNDIIRGNGGADVVAGENGSDTLRGGDGNDLVIGGFQSLIVNDAFGDAIDGDAGNDVLLGDSGLGGGALLAGDGGNDTISGGLGNDLIYGQGGNDLLVGNAGVDTLFGGDGNDRLVGGYLVLFAVDNSADNLFGEAGNDRLYGDSVRLSPLSVPPGGSGGGDFLSGGAGDDAVFGQAGNDRLMGDEGNDTLDGGDGHDHLIGDFLHTVETAPLTAGNDLLRGGAGNDTLLGDNGATSPTIFLNETVGGEDRLDGGAGHDRLFGQAANDQLVGGFGNDRLDGGHGSDKLVGGLVKGLVGLGDRGSDHLDGNEGDDWLAGDNVTPQAQPFQGVLQGGADILLGGGGNDTMFGQAGKDEMGGGFGADTMRGGAGNDILVGGVVVTGQTRTRDTSDDSLYGDAGNDRLYGDNVFNPLAPEDVEAGGNDKMEGGDGVDLLFGQGGLDVLLGGYGDDALRGGAGADTLVGGIVQGLLQLPDNGKDDLEGGDGDDKLCGDNVNGAYDPIGTAFSGGNDKLKGGSGNDTLHGQAGNDQLYGNVGADELFGGPGTDVESQDDLILP